MAADEYNADVTSERRPPNDPYDPYPAHADSFGEWDPHPSTHGAYRIYDEVRRQEVEREHEAARAERGGKGKGRGRGRGRGE
eukprot:4793698-Alexandrium_andersonii.AAC.1